MNESLQEQEYAEKSNLDNMENIRIGYQVASSHWIAGSDQFGSRFNAMLTVNSIFIAVIGVGLSIPQRVVAMSLSIMGLIVCIIWTLWMKRDLKYLKYLRLTTCEIEENYLSPVKTISRGNEFTEGEKVKIQGVKPFQMSGTDRLFRHRVYCYAIVLVFVTFYIAMLVVSLSL
jgi:hypothetical protein